MAIEVNLKYGYLTSRSDGHAEVVHYRTILLLQDTIKQGLPGASGAEDAREMVSVKSEG